MKRIAGILITMVLVSALGSAAVKVQAGIFSAGPNTIVVKVKPTGGAITGLLSSVTIPVVWETGAGITLSSVDYAPGLGGTDEGTSGVYTYAIYNMLPNSTVNWLEGSETVVLTLTFAGPGPLTVMLQNILPGSGYYFEAGATDMTNYGTPFYVESVELSLPVTLTSFGGKVNESGPGVELTWTTASEVNNYGYTVQRKLEQEQVYVDLADGFVAGHGTTVEAHTYSYSDKTVTASGRYAYRLKQVDLDGTVQYTQAVIVPVSLTAVAEAAPREFQLMQNYPNPFNPATMVKFSVPTTGQATMKVYDMVGQEVGTLFEGVAEAGRYYAVSFNAAQLASGVYFYRLVTEQKTDVRRMLVVK